MKILSLDTAMAACSVAVIDTEVPQPLAAGFVAMERGHAEALPPMVAEVMAVSGLVLSQIDRIAVTTGPGTFTGAFTISQRPAEAADRAVPGHWEGDLIIGANGGSAIGTLVERSTRFTILLHLPDDHTAESVATAMIEAMSELPAHLRRTITWDRGSEMARWRDIELQLQAPVYFCDPHSPWQRGSNENTNRLLRFWFDKGTDLRVHTKADLKRVQDKLNTRPRPTLDLDTPAQRLAALLDQAA